jgi:hypothetical protein
MDRPDTFHVRRRKRSSTSVQLQARAVSGLSPNWIDPNGTFKTRAGTEPLPEDRDWNTRARIWLRPKTGLTPRQAAVVRREYGFDSKLLCVETRKALDVRDWTNLVRAWSGAEQIISIWVADSQRNTHFLPSHGFRSCPDGTDKEIRIS